MIVFGPVPSRRLGQSLGINNIPPKKCSYSCVYCQLGPTKKMQINRETFYEPETIYREVEKVIKELRNKGGALDYLTFVCDGEPSLDINLGKTLDLLKDFQVKTAVISNASLIWQEDVKKDLAKADWVSLKIDALREDIWHRINKPRRTLELIEILNAIMEFAKAYKGTLVTETMLVEGYNDGFSEIEMLGGYLARLKPECAYLLVPTRPPAESHVRRVSGTRLAEIYSRIKELAQIKVECITGDEGDAFFIAEEVLESLLGILSVHPLREEVLLNILEERNISRQILCDLLEDKKIEGYEYEGEKFYRKKL